MVATATALGGQESVATDTLTTAHQLGLGASVWMGACGSVGGTAISNSLGGAGLAATRRKRLRPLGGLSCPNFPIASHGL
jgi:hypothetical protein